MVGGCWAGHLPFQCHMEVTTSVRVLPATPGWLQGMLRAMEGVSKSVLREKRAGGRSWPAAACDACATLVRPRAAGVSQKEVPAPGPGFLQSRPAAPPPPRSRAVLPAARWTSAGVPWPLYPSQYPAADGPWLMAPSQHPLANVPWWGLRDGAAAPGWCVGSRRWGYQSNLFFLLKNLHMQTLMRSSSGCFL